MIAGGKGGCWRKGRLLEERAVAGGNGGCSKERLVSKGLGRLFHQQLPLSINNCPLDNSDSRSGDKKGRVGERRGQLPRAVVGAVGTSISSPFCAKSKRVTTSQDDDFVGELAIRLVGDAASTKDLKGHRLSVMGRPMAIFAPMVSKKPGIARAFTAQKPSISCSSLAWVQSSPGVPVSACLPDPLSL